MLYQILAFLLDIAADLLGGACLLRLYMQHQKVPFGNQLGRFVFALTDWIVLPLRRVIPPIGRVDAASAVAAWLIVLTKILILWAIVGAWGGIAWLPVLAVFGVVKLAISAFMVLLIVYAIMSWVRSDSPLMDVIERLCAPPLRPLRKVIPLVGGVDLSPLALIVILQVLLIVVTHLQAAVMR
ncbi:MAG: YggT family protein [Burkholderiaceae bacterium]